MNDLKNKISYLAKQLANEMGVELFSVELIGTKRLLIRVTIDKEGGVTLDDCEKFSRDFSAILDVEDPIPQSYILEISSPGLDRPLRDEKDFEKNKGKLVRVITSEKIENQNFFLGRILDVEDNFVKLLVKNRIINIPFNKISRARLEIEL